MVTFRISRRASQKKSVVGIDAAFVVGQQTASEDSRPAGLYEHVIVDVLVGDIASAMTTYRLFVGPLTGPEETRQPGAGKGLDELHVTQ